MLGNDLLDFHGLSISIFFDVVVSQPIYRPLLAETTIPSDLHSCHVPYIPVMVSENHPLQFLHSVDASSMMASSSYHIHRDHLIIYTTSVRILAASAIAATSAPGGRP